MYFEQFKTIVYRLQPVEDDILKEIYQETTIKKFDKGDYILRANDICKYLYFVIEGGARSFYTTKTGKEKTRLIAFENRIVTVLHSLVQSQPSIETLQAMEDTVLVCIHRDKFFYFIERYPIWDRFYRRMLEEAFFYQNHKIENHITLTAQERYDILLKERPEYIQRVSNKILSSFIDVREETLSRLKSKSRF